MVSWSFYITLFFFKTVARENSGQQKLSLFSSVLGHCSSQYLLVVYHDHVTRNENVQNLGLPLLSLSSSILFYVSLRTKFAIIVGFFASCFLKACIYLLIRTRSVQRARAKKGKDELLLLSSLLLLY